MRKRYWMLLALVVSIVVVGGVVAIIAQPQGSQAATPEMPAWLKDAALSAAADKDDSSPTSIGWALTDTDAAEALMNGGAPGDAPVVASTPCYVAVVTGDFTYLAVRAGPLGSHELSGNTIVLVFDPKTHEITDFAFFEGNGKLDTSAIPDLQTVDVGATPAADQ